MKTFKSQIAALALALGSTLTVGSSYAADTNPSVVIVHGLSLIHI